MVYLEHMLDMAHKAHAKVRSISRKAFDADENLRFALAHLIQVIGQAAQHVSPALRREHPEIPWREVTGMRHRIVHDYMNVDDDVIWAVATEDLPQLIRQLEAFVRAERGDQ
jgi:uncharacterized protein with HEPN domain